MARICMSTPIRAADFIPIGSRPSLTTDATRSAPFSSATPCSGSTAITSTACVWTPSPPCSTSTIRASKASGFPTNLAGAKTWKRFRFLKQVNQEAITEFPGIQTIAEESTAWPMVSRPPYIGGLGFGMKWDMGWMHDTLLYFSKEPIHRKYHHNKLTFRGLYMFHRELRAAAVAR